MPQPRARDPEKHEWFLAFPEQLRWNGVLRVEYTARRNDGSWGRAYKYTSDLDTHTLRLGAPIHARGLRSSGFQCRPDEPATYTWARFERNYILRLTAVEEPCAIRRAILEGDWQFLD